MKPVEEAVISRKVGSCHFVQRHPVVEKWANVYSGGMEIGGCPLNDFASSVLQAYLKDGMNVLDVGCGTGRTIRHLHSMKFFAERNIPDVTGVDICMEALRRCKKGMQIICSDMFCLPFPSFSFDVILTRQIMEGYEKEEIQQLSLSFSAVLREGGFLIIEERGPMDSRARHSFKASETGGHRACRFLSRQDLTELFAPFALVDWEECLRRRNTPAGNKLVSHTVSLLLRKRSPSGVL